jgi:hypothetical protein
MGDQVLDRIKNLIAGRRPNKEHQGLSRKRDHRRSNKGTPAAESTDEPRTSCESKGVPNHGGEGKPRSDLDPKDEQKTNNVPKEKRRDEPSLSQPNDVPHLPCQPLNNDGQPYREPHRGKYGCDPTANVHLQTIGINACVARLVGRKEYESKPAAMEAMRKEWKRLWSKDVWDAKSVREWADVSAGARRKGHGVHMGRLFGIMVEKAAELPVGDPQRK